jgi:DNA-binding CsgD family transcriptional regulator
VDAPSAHGLGSLLPHLRSALRVRAQLDEAAQSIAVGAMDALRQIVVLCNRSGRMIACTGRAEEALRAADHLRVRSGRLEASDARSNGDLQAAIRRAGSNRERQDLQPALSSILLMSSAGRPTVADVVPLPSDCFDLRLDGVVLVSLPTGTAVRSSDLLKRAYGLTEAEADICRRLVDGDRVADIAAERQVTQLTVRNQIKAVFSKIGVRSQGELIRAVAVFAKSSDRSPETGS